ncbi:AP-3 complex subunit sigma [Platanthera zijinensis]|uniref:AP-3 complex subunit sigma n=1 Tax=Platanthera zijinensis TaxID=2320716 RepID=A0AAP0GBL8_9ASPA
MIRAVIVMNTQGKPRLVRFYEFQPPERQKELIRSIYGVLSSRADNVSNFFKTDAIFGEDTRLVYKHLATMYFVFVFDSSENELAMLDLIQVFVETLEKCFKNVCELDLVFNFTKVLLIFPILLFGATKLLLFPLSERNFTWLNSYKLISFFTTGLCFCHIYLIYCL